MPCLAPTSPRIALRGCLLLLIAALTPAHQAMARVFVGIGVPLFPPPVYYPPPPVYYPPPPVYYPPPPVYYAPPVQYSPPQGYPAPSSPAQQTCFAGAYTCPMDRPVYSGSACYCPGSNGTRVWGHAR